MRRAAPHRSLAYDASDRKTFASALGRLLSIEFPQVFGPQVTRLFVAEVIRLFDEFHPDRDRLKVGQVLWSGVAVDDPPTRGKRMEDTRLVPIVLDLVTAQDIDAAIATGLREETRARRILRMFDQAFAQGAVLSYPDVSLLTHLQTSTISRTVCQHEEKTGQLVPRRGTIHDMGRSVTHKAIICRKRLVEKKSTQQVAQETNHDPQSVEYYVQTLRRVWLCSNKGLSTEDIVQAIGHSKSLVEEYLNLIQELGLADLSDLDDSSSSPQS